MSQVRVTVAKFRADNGALTGDPDCGRCHFRRRSCRGHLRSNRNAITIMPDSQIGSDPLRQFVGDGGPTPELNASLTD